MSRRRYKLAEPLKKAGFELSGGWGVEIDVDAFEEISATMAADEIATNMGIGQKPSGKGTMPKAKTTKLPRGFNTHIVSTIHARKRAEGQWVIAADEKVPGQLRRVLKGVKLVTPDMNRIFDVALQTLLNPDNLERELK